MGDDIRVLMLFVQEGYIQCSLLFFMEFSYHSV